MLWSASGVIGILWDISGVTSIQCDVLIVYVPIKIILLLLYFGVQVA